MTNTPFDAAAPETWEALARYVTGESSLEEVRALRAWLDAEPQRHELVETMRQMLDSMTAPTADVDVEAALRRVRARAGIDTVPVLSLPQRRARHWYQAPALRAAAVVAVVGAGVLLWRARDASDRVPPELAAYRTEVGQMDTLRLLDGSLVVLGPASELRVAEGYGEGARTVSLRGVALFEVAHDEQRPFVVHAGNTTVTDLGTVFTVWHDTDDAVRVAVTEGSVLLARGDASLVLQAGDRGAIEEGLAQAARGAATAADQAWTRGELHFDAARLATVATELRRWYGIELRANAFAERQVTATFRAEDSAQHVLDVIAAVLGATLEMRGDTAVLHTGR